MNAYVYLLHVSIPDSDILLDKINELGYTARHVVMGDTFQVYKVEMDSEDLMILKLTVPSLEIDNLDKENHGTGS
jgi:hypothetical protein